MSERIMTLFGEEIIPEQLKAVGKSRAKKNKEEEKSTEEPKQQEEQAFPIATGTETKYEEPAQVKPQQAAQVKEEVVHVAEQPRQAEEEVLPVPIGTKKKRAKPNEENVILPEDWQGEKKYYSIGEVADLFKVNTSHIRFWTNEFKLKVRTTRKGDRLYTPEQIKELRTIHHLVKERGFTLTGAKAKLKNENSIDVQTIDLKQSLLQLRNKLVIIKNQLS